MPILNSQDEFWKFISHHTQSVDITHPPTLQVTIARNKAPRRRTARRGCSRLLARLHLVRSALQGTSVIKRVLVCWEMGKSAQLAITVRQVNTQYLTLVSRQWSWVTELRIRKLKQGLHLFQFRSRAIGSGVVHYFIWLNPIFLQEQQSQMPTRVQWDSTERR